MSNDDRQYFGVILEDIRDQNRLVLEAVGDMQRHVAHIPQMRDDIAELKSDMKVVKAVLKDTNRQVHSHERRISALEIAVF